MGSQRERTIQQLMPLCYFNPPKLIQTSCSCTGKGNGVPKKGCGTGGGGGGSRILHVWLQLVGYRSPRSHSGKWETIKVSSQNTSTTLLLAFKSQLERASKRMHLLGLEVKNIKPAAKILSLGFRNGEGEIPLGSQAISHPPW